MSMICERCRCVRAANARLDLGDSPSVDPEFAYSIGSEIQSFSDVLDDDTEVVPLDFGSVDLC